MNKCGCVRDSPSKSKVVVLIENLAVDPIADGMLSFLCTVLFVERVQLCKCEIWGTHDEDCLLGNSGTYIEVWNQYGT